MPIAIHVSLRDEVQNCYLSMAPFCPNPSLNPRIGWVDAEYCSGYLDYKGSLDLRRTFSHSLMQAESLPSQHEVVDIPHIVKDFYLPTKAIHGHLCCCTWTFGSFLLVKTYCVLIVYPLLVCTFRIKLLALVCSTLLSILGVLKQSAKTVTICLFTLSLGVPCVTLMSCLLLRLVSRKYKSGSATYTVWSQDIWWQACVQFCIYPAVGMWRASLLEQYRSVCLY